MKNDSCQNIAIEIIKCCLHIGRSRKPQLQKINPRSDSAFNLIQILTLIIKKDANYLEIELEQKMLIKLKAAIWYRHRHLITEWSIMKISSKHDFQKILQILKVYSTRNEMGNGYAMRPSNTCFSFEIKGFSRAQEQFGYLLNKYNRIKIHISLG